MSPIIIALAAVAAIFYATGSLFIKQSLSRGASSRRAIAVTNVAMAVWALPLFFLSRGDFSWVSLWVAAGAGVALFVGRIFSVKALEAGDLSIVGPLLGMKTLLVALFTFLTGQAEMTPEMWLAAVAATVAVFLLQRSPDKQVKHNRSAFVYALFASVLFALTDILVVEARVGLGVGWLAPLLFISVALLVPFLGRIPKEPPQASRSLLAGAGIMGFQTTLVVALIALTGQAVLINIIYCSRALWSVVVDRLVCNKQLEARYFGFRLAGASLLVLAVSTVFLELYKPNVPTSQAFVLLEQSKGTDTEAFKPAQLSAAVTDGCFCKEPEDKARCYQGTCLIDKKEDVHWPY